MNNLRRKKVIAIVVTVLISLFILFCAGYYFAQTHFLWGTTIDDISCSLLSIEDAIEKINLEKGEEMVTFGFTNGQLYEVSLEQLGIRVDESQITQIFEQQHLNPKATREYDLNGFILVDTEKLREFLGQIPELQKENMIEPQNAYIIWNETEFLIHKEVLGNVINFEEAMELALVKIKNNEKVIDFSSITVETPEILEENLVEEVNQLNSVLNTTINFVLSDGTIVTLDSNIIKNWVYQDDNGKFVIDVEVGIPEFVEDLASNVNDANSYMQFVATNNDGLATVNVPIDVRAQLDKENQIAEIMSLLGNPKPIYMTPIYDRPLISLESYIEIDIFRQHIWFYKDGVLIVDTPCVTGNVSDGHATPTGVFFLKNKNRNVYLEGFNNDGTRYSSFVKYWMRFNQGIGMHDASWRIYFGGSIYLTGGSHGCVNMPEEAAAITFENIDNTIPIIVYQSNL